MLSLKSPFVFLLPFIIQASFPCYCPSGHAVFICPVEIVSYPQNLRACVCICMYKEDEDVLTFIVCISGILLTIQRELGHKF